MRMTAARFSPVFFFSLAVLTALLCSDSSFLICISAACLPAAFGVGLSCWRDSRWRMTVVYLLAASLGLTAAWARSQGSLEAAGFCGIPLSRVTAFRGRLVEDSGVAEKGDTRYRLQLATVSCRDMTAPARGRVLVMVPGGEKMYIGQNVVVQGGLRRLDEAGRDHYLCRASASGIISEGFCGELFDLRSRLRRALSLRVDSLAPQAAGLTRALLFGEREALRPETVARFRASGSYHVLALSGLHVGILFLLVRALFAFLPGRNTAFGVAAVFLLLYLGLIGLRPSLTRAVLMLITAGIGRVLDRDSRPLNSLALAAAVIMLANPAAVNDLSFQLSFLSLLGIICLGPEISRRLVPHLPAPISMALACSLAAQAASAPVLLARFGIVYPIGIVASLLVIPLVTLLVWLGLLYLPLASLPLLGPAVAYGLKQAAALLELVTSTGSRAPGWQPDWRLYTVILAAGCLLYTTGRGVAGKRDRLQGVRKHELRFAV
jgi:competence protein ComEC